MFALLWISMYACADKLHDHKLSNFVVTYTLYMCIVTDFAVASYSTDSYNSLIARLPACSYIIESACS